MKKILICAALLVLAALVLGFALLKDDPVPVVALQQVAAVQTVYATGTVEAERMIPVSPKVTARLMALQVDEGSRVKAGDVLAQLEDIDLRQSLADMEAKRDLAQKYLARIEPLAKTGGVSKQMLDEAKASLASAAAAVEKAQAELSYLQLVAPEAGTIIRRDGEVGELAVAGTAVFWINGGDKIRIETEVDEEDISLVAVGQQVLIGADAYPGQIFQGRVSAITPKGDPVARSYRVRLALEEQGAPLMIGMTAETNIITQEKDSALMVPLSAVKDGYLIVIDHAKAQHKSVKTGIRTQKAVEILDGVGAQEQIAEKYDATLLERKRIHADLVEWDAQAKD